MVKYTDEQIKKALECCRYKSNSNCDCCPYREVAYCWDVLRRDAVDLINRQEAEKAELKETLNATIAGQETLQKYLAEKEAKIEKLKEESETLEKLYMSFLPTPQTAAEQLKKHQAERAKNEHLRELYAEIERLKEKNRLACQCTPKAIRRAKSEAIKEFAERLKELMKYEAVIYDRHIDNLVKEMVGESK
jgi:hypothetical protein